MQEEEKVIKYIAGVPVIDGGLYSVTFLMVDHEWRLVQKVRTMILLHGESSSFGTFATHSRRFRKSIVDELSVKSPADELLFSVCDLRQYLEIEISLEEQFPVFNLRTPKQGEASPSQGWSHS